MIEKEKNYGKYVFLVFEIIALLVSIICFYRINLYTKHWLSILPFGFFIISIVFTENFMNVLNNISKLLLISLFFVRLVMLPFLYSGNIETHLFEGNVSVDEHFFESCVLMVYEYFVVQLVLYFYEHKRNDIHWIIFKKVTSNIDISKILVICLAIYVLGIAIFLPQYCVSFKTIFKLAEADFAVAVTGTEYSIGTVGRILKTLFSMSVQLFRIMFPALLMKQLFDHNSKSRSSTIVLVLSCFLQFVFLTSTFAEAIVSCLALVLYYIKLYPHRKSKTFLFLTTSTLGMVILYFTIRYFANTTGGLYSKSSGAMVYAAQIINAYFTGIDNVAATFNIPSGYARETFRAGLLGAIPFNSTLFGNRGKKFQYYYNLYNNAYGQIPPTIGTGYYYFGAFLSPVISGLFVILSMRYYKKSEHMEASLRYVAVVFCSIVFALGTVMYSPSITLSWYFSWGIPMLLLTLFT